MKKPNIFEMLADVPKRVIDENAFTNEELAKQVGVGRWQMGIIIRERIKSGKWERVFKRVGRQMVPAYRVKK